MKPTGLIRYLNKLARLVIPKEIRDTLGISKHTPMEILTDGENIVLKKHSKSCTFCNECFPEEFKIFKGHLICNDCLESLKKIKQQ